jgi:hypothetical protein
MHNFCAFFGFLEHKAFSSEVDAGSREENARFLNDWNVFSIEKTFQCQTVAKRRAICAKSVQ